MAGPFVIGLDVGTSAVKCAVYGHDGRRSEVTRHAMPATTGDDGNSTQDPDRIRATVLAVLTECVRATDVPIAAIALSTAMHGLAGLGRDLTPVTPLLTWADARAAAIVETWHHEGLGGDLHRRTGVPMHPMAPLAKLAWFTTVRPEVATRVHRWVGLKALVVQALCGEVVTEVSSASGWGVMDIAAHTWDAEALTLAGVDAERLPAIESGTTTLPVTDTVAEGVGLPAGTPVVLGAADGPLGNVGVGAFEPGVAALSLGTSGAVRIIVDALAPPEPGVFCYALDTERWVLGGAVSNGGSVVPWLARTLLGRSGDEAEDLAAVMDLATQSPPGANGVAMIPYLLPERSPLWDPSLPGAWLGLRNHHTRADLARAAIEGVAAALAAVTDRVDAVQPIARVRATGGAFEAPLWRAVVAAALDRPVSVVNAADGSARGAAAFGFVAIGAADDLESASGLLNGGTGPETVRVAPEMVDAAHRTRAVLGDLAATVGRVADAFA